ncbi:hypothetical protein ACFQ08_03185 [Streptosporangium algeriense]|uniref:Uncharacterized protein n=1 Tax=Streptosporangium algeriense TaxID=1682748 RepID=A0ABW3DIJ6_9ACTN
MATYTVETNGDVALSAAIAKTIINVINSANGVVKLVELSVSFDGTTANAEPVTVELCKSTQATAGTSTSHTMAQNSGPTRTVQATAARNYTAEPTVLTVLKRWLVHPQAGLLIQFPLGREPMQVTGSQGLAVRCTAPAPVNVQGYMEIEEG